MAKKKKTKIRVKRYVTITKTVVKSGKDTKSNKKKKTKQVNGIGTFADLKFYVKTDEDGNLQMFSPTEVSTEVAAEWQEHRIIGRKFPKMEFIGAFNRTFSMTIVVDRQFGKSPHSVIAKLNKFCETGKVSELHIGSHKIGGGNWYIQSISQAWDKIYSKGQLTRATLSLTLGLCR